MNQQQLVVKKHLINYYEKKSEKAEKTLLFLHGWRSEGNVWRQIFEELT